MRCLISALITLVATPGAAEELHPICYAAMDRLARAQIAAIRADPEIMAWARRPDAEVDLTAITETLVAKVEDPTECAVLLLLPQSSIDGLGRAFAAQLKQNLG